MRNFCILSAGHFLWEGHWHYRISWSMWISKVQRRWGPPALVLPPTLQTKELLSIKQWHFEICCTEITGALTLSNSISFYHGPGSVRLMGLMGVQHETERFCFRLRHYVPYEAVNVASYRIEIQIVLVFLTFHVCLISDPVDNNAPWHLWLLLSAESRELMRRVGQ